MSAPRMNTPPLGRCIICGSKLEGDANLCPSHSKAEKSVRDGYQAWSRAYGTISPEEYFTKLSKLSETGDRVKELVQYYQSNPDKWKEKLTT